ncbi:hypothetical protein Pen02_63960 [Plantactinospora endophytica]|uniref:Uncharacterized protein n=1 Tax=Plantactinospora endophytica TaxID=673535 RepID=A0ABQ4E9W5_9ACTN|nr:hypothetical protein Pen02_63960 [Plantactinospora endophytica]
MDVPQRGHHRLFTRKLNSPARNPSSAIPTSAPAVAMLNPRFGVAAGRAVAAVRPAAMYVHYSPAESDEPAPTCKTALRRVPSPLPPRISDPPNDTGRLQTDTQIFRVQYFSVSFTSLV